MTNNKCPFCGAPLNWREMLAQKKRGGPAWGPWEERRFGLFGLGDVAALPAGAEYERRRPVRDPSVESDVLTPGLQTLISGVVGGMVSAAVAVTVGWARPWAYGLAGGAGILGIAWTALLADHRALLWEVERVTGADLDGDGVAGEPVREREPNLVYVRDPARMRRREQARDFRFWLREAYGERGTTWRSWDGAELPSGERVTRPLWEEYTERLQRAGLAERAYSTAPLETVGSYRQALETFAEVL